MLRYAITDRSQFAGDECQRQGALVKRCATLARHNIDYIQLREKDLSTADLVILARTILKTVPVTSLTRLLISSRPDIAIATQAPGVHLSAAANALTPDQVRQLYARAGLPRPHISVSCHSTKEVVEAAKAGADLALFGPVFGKTVRGVQVMPGTGLEALTRACQSAPHLSILALGGITEQNQAGCLQAGAAGIAGIRIFASDQTSNRDALETA